MTADPTSFILARMLEQRALTASDVVVGCVTEDNPKYLAQALRLLQSIRWFGGELSRARVIVGAVERIDTRARRSLERLGAEIRIVPRFDARNGSGNRLQLFGEMWEGREEILLSLDCDTLVVRDPLPLLRRGVFQAKIAPLPTITHEVFERLFAHEGIELPPRSFTTGYTGTPTIPYFNAGVIAMSVDVAHELIPVWRHYNRLLAGKQELVDPCAKHLHQAALALALAVSRVPVAEAPPELNYQLNATHLPPPPGYADLDPYIIHYHDLVNEEGSLLPCPFPLAQERIDRFHQMVHDEHPSTMDRDEHRPVAGSSPQQIAVLGMHRSGTSVVAQALAAMGCYTGSKRELVPPDVYNPTGYWERRDVVALNEEILRALDASWLDTTRADTGRLPEVARQKFAERARGIVRSLDTHGSWIVKDPRLSILFPLWRDVLDHPICVLVWREPVAVARSLERRDGLPLALGLAVWEEYTRAMLASTIGLSRVLVSYGDLVSDPPGCVSQLRDQLVLAGASDLRLPSHDTIRAIVEPSLNHQSRDEGVFLSQAQSALCDALRSGAALAWEAVPPSGQGTPEFVSFARQWQERGAGESELAEMLTAVFASRSWRIGFAITRLWRRFVPSADQTVIDRWNKRRNRER